MARTVWCSCPTRRSSTIASGGWVSHSATPARSNTCVEKAPRLASLSASINCRTEFGPMTPVSRGSSLMPCMRCSVRAAGGRVLIGHLLVAAAAGHRGRRLLDAGQFLQLLGAAAAGHGRARQRLLRLARPVRRGFPVVGRRRQDGALVVEVEVDLLLRLRAPVADLAQVVELALEAGLQERLQAAQQVAPPCP